MVDEGRSAVREVPGTMEVPESRLAELDSLETEVAELAGVVNAAHGRLVELVAKALDEGLWAQPGIHTPVQWLSWQSGVTRGNARRVVALARRSRELPVTVEALRRGSLSLDQAAVVGRHVPATHEASAAALAQAATVDQLERTLARYSFDPGDCEGPATVPADQERREVSFGATEAGRWRLHADLPLDEGSRLERALSAKREALFQAAGEPAERRAITWADALLELGDAAMSVTDAQNPASRRACVYVHLEADPVDPDRPGGVSSHLGRRLPESLARLLLCDCDVRPVWERCGAPVSLGRTRRVVPARLRRLIEHRDGGCRVPGCGRRRGLQIHHVRHWQDGGPTDTANLVALCPYHHRLHHLGRLGLTGDADDPDGISVTDHHGRRLEPAGRARAPDGLPRAVPYEHPLGESFDPHWLTLMSN